VIDGRPDRRIHNSFPREGGVSPRARDDANGEEGNKKEQLLQQQRPQRRNPSALEAAGEQAGQKEDQHEDRNR